MSKSRIQRLAEVIKSLTYDEMMEVSEWFSIAMMAYDDEGNELGSPVGKEEMAQYLSDFAEYGAGE